MNFENLENRLDFVCQLAGQPASQPASQPAGQPAGQPYVRPGCASCMVPEILHCKGNPVGYTKLLFQ